MHRFGLPPKKTKETNKQNSFIKLEFRNKGMERMIRGLQETRQSMNSK